MGFDTSLSVRLIPSYSGGVCVGFRSSGLRLESTVAFAGLYGAIRIEGAVLCLTGIFELRGLF